MPTLPSCYIYFSWWQLRFTTQHSKYKWCGVKGDGSDRFATSRRDFKILVPERLPVPEGGRDTARRAPAGEGDGGGEELGARWMWKWSCASGWETQARADGGGLGCQSHDGMAQTVSREWGNTAKQGNWEHKDGTRESRRKAKNLSRMKKPGYMRRRRPLAHLQVRLPWSRARKLDSEYHLLEAPVPSADSWFHPRRGTLRELEDQHRERFTSCLTSVFWVSVLLRFPLQRQPSPPSTAFTLQAVLGHSIPPVLDQREAIISYLFPSTHAYLFVIGHLIKCSVKCPLVLAETLTHMGSCKYLCPTYKEVMGTTPTYRADSLTLKYDCKLHLHILKTERWQIP